MATPPKTSSDPDERSMITRILADTELPIDPRDAKAQVWVSFLAIAFIALLASAMSVRQIRNGGFRNPEEASHALSGLMLLDMYQQRTWSHATTFAEEYDARYPAINIPNTVPPLFHGVEAFFLGWLGVSVVSARYCVLAFHVGAVVLTYILVRRQHTIEMAFLSAVLFAVSPVSLEISRQVVLEPAATLGILGSCILWMDLVRRPTRPRLVWWGVVTAVAMTAQQTVAFMIPIQLFGILVLIRSRRTQMAAAGWLITLFLLNLYYWKSVSLITPKTLWDASPTDLWNRADYYVRSLPEIVGWPTSALIVLGVAAIIRRPWRVDTLSLALIASFSSYVLAIDPPSIRPTYVMLPFACLVAARGTTALLHFIPYPMARGMTLLGVLAPCLTIAAFNQSRIIDGYEQAAQIVAKMPGGSSVLVEGRHEADLVFFLRMHDTHRRIVLRGGRSIYAYNPTPKERYQQFINSDTELVDLLKDYGVRWIIIEDKQSPGFETPGSELLQKTLKTSPFQLVSRVRLRKFWWDLLADELLIYEFKSWQPARAESLRIPMPLRPKGDLVVPMSRLLKDSAKMKSAPPGNERP